jgi:hypothetical protein
VKNTATTAGGNRCRYETCCDKREYGFHLLLLSSHPRWTPRRLGIAFVENGSGSYYAPAELVRAIEQLPGN